ncbi:MULTISPECIES: enoyl-CoA hydratase/isomerase family protein [Pseudomonas]|uniref:enoyl-CoA hydratase/isomerase family protein n=1 Tax=Pseudomonas TaxID=286 RepID=UPI0008E9B16E|nr:MULTISPECIES: enoyl-CoA hydratase/isomerase family protein [Pseudomonas]SFT81937.1 Enoyl-CoA hydratase/carnithine racemase [Pseudomonas marincola]
MSAEQIQLTSPVINDAVRLEIDGMVGWVVLTRPGQINAINDAIREGVPQALALLQNNPSVRVIVFRGEGERGFCAGADIKERRGPESSLQVRQRMENVRWIESLDAVSKPVIAAIHGYCMGGGMELVLACDIRFAAPNAIFALPETGLGLIPGGGGTQRLSRVVAPGQALDMLLTGDRMTAEQAQRIGLVSRVASDNAKLLEEVREFAQRIASKPPTASAFVKKAARAALELDLKSGLNLELDLFALLVPTKDAREAAQAFSERREPRFTGE